MSGAAAGEAAWRPSIAFVARDVIDAMEALPPAQAAAIARAMRMLDELPGEQIRLTVPDAPDWARWRALVPPDDSAAPAIIYRRLPHADGEGWRVAALMPRADYDRYRAAEAQGLFRDPAVRLAAVAATDVAIATMGTISAMQPHDPSRGGRTPPL